MAHDLDLLLAGILIAALLVDSSIQLTYPAAVHVGLEHNHMLALLLVRSSCS